MVELDVAKESVSAKEVEGIGLNAPKDSAEALERVKCNLIFYRQNYVLVLYVSALLSHLTNPLVAVALLAAGGAVACVSDTLLGELSMLTNDKLVWNATRVAGVDREQTRTGLAALAAVSLACSIRYNAGSLLASLASGMTMVLIHAVLRPIDLKSTLSNLWKDVTNVQNREEAEAMVKKSVKGIQSWWNNRRPTEPTPVVVSVKEVSHGSTGPIVKLTGPITPQLYVYIKPPPPPPPPPSSLVYTVSKALRNTVGQHRRCCPTVYTASTYHSGPPLLRRANKR